LLGGDRKSCLVVLVGQKNPRTVAGDDAREKTPRGLGERLPRETRRRRWDPLRATDPAMAPARL